MTQKRMTSYERRKVGTRAKLRRINIDQNPNRVIRPRLSVHRTNKQIYVQVIDDVKGVTLAAASSLEKESGLKMGHSIEAASKVGQLIAERAVKAGVKKVQFDRGAYLYHGRVKALAESARAGGLEF